MRPSCSRGCPARAPCKALGAFLVRNGAGQVFKIGAGFNDALRRNPPAVGSPISYRYCGLTSSGLPRSASFWRQLES